MISYKVLSLASNPSAAVGCWQCITNSDLWREEGASHEKWPDLSERQLDLYTWPNRYILGYKYKRRLTLSPPVAALVPRHFSLSRCRLSSISGYNPHEGVRLGVNSLSNHYRTGSSSFNVGFLSSEACKSHVKKGPIHFWKLFRLPSPTTHPWEGLSWRKSTPEVRRKECGW